MMRAESGDWVGDTDSFAMCTKVFIFSSLLHLDVYWWRPSWRSGCLDPLWKQRKSRFFFSLSAQYRKLVLLWSGLTQKPTGNRRFSFLETKMKKGKKHFWGKIFPFARHKTRNCLWPENLYNCCERVFPYFAWRSEHCSKNDVYNFTRKFLQYVHKLWSGAAILYLATAVYSFWFGTYFVQTFMEEIAFWDTASAAM